MKLEHHFNSLCDGPLWNSSTAYSDSPDFTQCFHDTFLVWFPCFMLWIVAPLWTYMLTRRNSFKIRISVLFILKCAAILCLIAIEIFKITRAALDNKQKLHYYMTPSILIFSYLLCLLFVHFERKRGLKSSTLLFTFWLFLAIFISFTLRSIVLNRTNNNSSLSTLQFTVFIAFYVLVLLNVVLFSFAEKHYESRYEKNNKEEALLTDNDTSVDEKTKLKEFPEESVSLPSRLTFWWLTNLIITGFKRDLIRSDLWRLDDTELSEKLTNKFELNWTQKASKYVRERAKYGPIDDENDSDEKKKNKKKKQEKEAAAAANNEEQIQLNVTEVPQVEIKRGKKPIEPSFIVSLCQVYGGKFLAGAFIKLAHDILLFAGPMLLDRLISFIKDKNQSFQVGIFYTGLIFFTAFVQSFCLQHYFHRMFIVGGRIRTAVMNVIYKKALKLSTLARKQSTVGEMTNLISVNSQMLADLITYLNTLWSAPFQITVTMIMLWRYLGPASLAGLATMIAFIPWNIYIGNKNKQYQAKKLKVQDSRIKMTNEVLNGIRIIKFYGWELSFKDIIGKIRSKELSIFKRIAYLTVASLFSWSCAPFLVAAVSFATYVLASDDNVLDASTAFVSISLFNILRFPLSVLPGVISQLITAKVSVDRIRAFLLRDELDEKAITYNDSDRSIDVKLENVNLSWDEKENTLEDLNFEVKPGKLVAIVGPVGSGKSSLLSGILGEMKLTKENSKIIINGQTAYVPQQAWIKNATIKDNILFGVPFHEENYNKVIESCALLTDFDIMPHGDRTEIGEKGINLSGGQKQRISLARSVYSNADIYMFDDPLSAVDSHVGKHIFDSVVGPNGLLRNKTRLFVTNSINFLYQTDFILMLENGRIVQMGTFDELKSIEAGSFAKFIKNSSTNLVKKDNEQPEIIKSPLKSKESVDRERSATTLQQATGDISSKNADKTPGKKGGENIIVQEKIATGNVKLATIYEYLKACRIWLTIVFLTVFAISNVASIAANVWLSMWSNDPNNKDSNKYFRLGIYVLLGFLQCIITLVADFINLGMLLASIRKMHDDMLISILKSTMEFFESTPTGRIINRFSKDIDAIERSIPESFRTLLRCLFHVLSTVILISASTPLFIIALVPIIVIYIFLQRFFVASMRQLKRLESASKSPIFSHFNETLTGVSTIRAYRAQNRFTLMMQNHIDENLTYYYPSNIANRWLALRLELIGNLITVFASLFAVISRDSISAGIAGLSISYSLNISQTLNWLVRMSSDFEANIVSVERIKEYCETPHEAEWTIEDKKPPANWPDQGQIQFVDFNIRYRENLDPVLRNITFDVKPGEKIGIVGRTGAGKSSLSLSLFRLLERSTGKIFIDNIDIKEIGLHDLRHKLTIIPQDPVLFSGTLRTNLDPFGSHTDEQIWSALENAHLKQFVIGLDKKLDYECSEGGENLSVGQRQLVCLARALLRKTKILLLDEATAAVDHNTDDLIQKTIKNEFADCTVLTIAHRLNTIIDSSRILVLDKGVILELDKPEVLLANKNSLFFSMARDAGLV